MTLGELIETLEKYPPAQAVPVGVTSACSHRGDYLDLAFVVDLKGGTVGQWLDLARSALDQPFEVYKGGTYTMRGGVWVHLVEDASVSGARVSSYLLRGWLGDPPKPPPAVLVTRASVVASVRAVAALPMMDAYPDVRDRLMQHAQQVRDGAAGLEGVVF